MRPHGWKDANRRKRKSNVHNVQSSTIENYLIREKKIRVEISTDERCPLSELPVPGSSNELPTEPKQSDDQDKSSDPIRVSPLTETCERSTKESTLTPTKRVHYGEILDDYLKQKDKSSAQTRANLFSNHKNLRPRMRSVLLEWVMEVSDVYKLHRETYFLAVDYVDRYLSLTKDIPKNQLQLIGVTCLLLAAKYEEIYPPKISELAYITDGACTEDDIKKMEHILVKEIGWTVSVKTPESWISAFFQLIYYRKFSDSNIHIPQFPVALFQRAACLLDLISLDEGFIKFHYKTIAATVLFLTTSKSIALSASGFTLSDIAECLHWFRPFWKAIKENFNFEDLTDEDSLFELGKPTKPNDFSHAVLTHRVTLDLLESAQFLQEARDRESSCLMTPPASSEKPPSST